MTKVISVIIWGLILCSSGYAQQKTYGYKISGNGDIVSNVFLIQNDFVLESAYNSMDTSRIFRFEYDKQGKLKRDINFIRNVTRVYDTTGVRPVWRNKYFPGYRDYYYNETGNVDSVAYGYWKDSLWVSDSSGGRINYSNDGKVISEIYSSKGTVYYFVENSYDSTGILTLSMHSNSIFVGSGSQIYDTTYIFREYDTQNRLTLIKACTTGVRSNHIDQTIYQYDSTGNVSWFPRAIDIVITSDSIIIDTTYTQKFCLIFDETGKALDRMHWISGFIVPDTWTWIDDGDIPLNYDEYGRILNTGPNNWFHYNIDGNLDTLVVLHPIYSVFLGATLVDSYGNHITLSDYTGYNCFYYSSRVTGIEKSKVNAITFSLSQNYPNPFNPTTTIAYSLPKSSLITLKIYDLLGREIATLVNEKKNSGTYNVTWDAQNVPSGVYFYKLTAGAYSKANKMILLK